MNEPIIGEAWRRGRRQILLGGAAGAVAWFRITPTFATNVTKEFGDLGAERPSPAASSELFAYPTRGGRSTMVAVTWLEPPFTDGPSSTSQITLHAGRHRWSGTVGSRPTVLDAPAIDHRASIADMSGGRPTAGGRPMGFFVEAPTDVLTEDGALQVWAERRQLDTSRRRIGSPLMTPLIDAYAGLSNAYHALDPDADRQVLLPHLQEAIASKSRPDADPVRSRRLALRLAEELLPDVLHYDPAEPCGFTFAARNGRFPSERCDAIVRSVLTRSVSS